MLLLILLLLASPCATSTIDLVVTVPVYHLRQPAQVASWYHLPGRQTASGALYGGMTAASLEYDLGDTVTVTRTDNGRSVRVVITDRGPYVKGRHIDLSRAAARKLGMIGEGLAQVTMRSE